MSPQRSRRYLFLLANPGESTILPAHEALTELGVRVTAQHGLGALIGLATPEQAHAAAESRLFAAVTRGPVSAETQRKLAPEHAEGVRIWNARQSGEFRKLSKDLSNEGLSWNDPKIDPEAPPSRIDPRDFRQRLLEKAGPEVEELLKKYADTKEPMDFAEFERRLVKRLDDADLAFELARIIYELDPVWHLVILQLDPDLIAAILRVLLEESPEWRLGGRIAVGVVFVESSQQGGPTFSAGTRSTLEAEITDGLDWLADEAPTPAGLTWVYDWQYITVSVANGTNTSTEDYWRDPAMAALNYFGNTYAAAWASVADYREDMRTRNNAAHAIVIFVTPYATKWHAYAKAGRATLANRNNWGGWGIGTIDRITAHEVCHLFGAADEYDGTSGTPCLDCTSLHGVYQIPNGNCAVCARAHQSCIMDQNTRRLCPWTQAHLGWADLFVELTTADELWAGTDDDVWLDIGDRTFVLDTPGYDDRERDNRDGYALNYTGLTRADIKRVGIRKSPDGSAGGWKLKRVRVWVRGEIVCDSGTINQWLEDEYRWWASTSCGSSTDIVNRLRVEVTTADVTWAGTDDDVTLYLAGRSWDLDNEGHDDFERGHTDTFNLDPGTGFYQSAIGQIRIHKAHDGVAGGWKLKGLRIDVDGSTIYNNQGINKWLEDDDRDWYGHI